jgi:hypothetical protein
MSKNNDDESYGGMTAPETSSGRASVSFTHRSNSASALQSIDRSIEHVMLIRLQCVLNTDKT